MLKKIIFKTLVVYFLLVNFIQAAETGGMPQLDPEFWFSQIFWLVITFGILYLVLSKIILPKISDNLETRKSQVLDNLDCTSFLMCLLDGPVHCVRLCIFPCFCLIQLGWP